MFRSQWILVGWIVASVVAVGLAAEPSPNADKAAKTAVSDTTMSPRGEFFINLGDYAKGDGSDETDAIQKAIDAIPSLKDWPKADTKLGGRLYVPRPKKFYGISKTLDFTDKWNITVECESPVFGGRMAPSPTYFKWIGATGDQPIFSFNMVLGARIINLSVDGRRAERVDEALQDHRTRQGQGGRPRVRPAARQRHHRRLRRALEGAGSRDGRLSRPRTNGRPSRTSPSKRAKWASGSADTPSKRTPPVSSASDVYIVDCGSHGVVVNSTMAVVKIDNLLVHGSGISNVRLYGGDVGLSQYVGTGTGKDMVADIELRGGGLRVVARWSETRAPFIRAKPEWHMYPYMPRVIIGVQHGCPVGYDTSIDYDAPAPLNLIGCSFRGDVLAGPTAGTILAMGVTFGHPDAGFGGEGITKHHRLVRIGTAALESADPSRAIVWGLAARTAPPLAEKGTSPTWTDPYLVDRRNWPGDGPPKTGLWQKGDGVVNTDPNPNVPAKAWRGWICIKAGEPGEWCPYGRLESPSPSEKSAPVRTQ